MTWILYFALLLVGAGVGGGIVGFLLSRNLPGPGVHTGPMLVADESADHPRYGKLLDTPAEGIGVAFPEGTIYVGAHERFIPRKRTPDHAPWSGSFHAVPDVATLTQEYETQEKRVSWIKSQLPANEDDVTREDLERVLAGLRALPAPSGPVYGETSVATLLAAERGLSFDCGNGLHAPVCDGRNCSCGCHRSAA